jgi:general secretion pathway protein G
MARSIIRGDGLKRQTRYEKGQTAPVKSPDPARGFTLIELLIVMAILGVLISIAAPNLKQSIVRAREAVLKEDLFQIREAIDQYYADNDKYPAALSDLINAQAKNKSYLRVMPKDPFTNAEDWVTVAVESSGDSSADSGGDTGIFDIHSASPLVAIDGTPYNTW